MAVGREGDTSVPAGGVYVGNGSFTMNGGTITGNVSHGDGYGVYVLMDGAFTVSGSFNDRIRLNFCFDIPEAFADEGAYVTLTDESSRAVTTLPAGDAEYVEGSGRNSGATFYPARRTDERFPGCLSAPIPSRIAGTEFQEVFLYESAGHQLQPRARR